MGIADIDPKMHWNDSEGKPMHADDAKPMIEPGQLISYDPSAKMAPPSAGFSLPTDPKARKTYPMGTGLIDYFPDALAAVAHVSYTGNEQHNPGTPLHWDRTKSTDEFDTLIRHLTQRGQLDTDGLRHTAKAAWRALALLQKELEAER